LGGVGGGGLLGGLLNGISLTLAATFQSSKDSGKNQREWYERGAVGWAKRGEEKPARGDKRRPERIRAPSAAPVGPSC